jgi:hypothetical protein
MNKQYIINYWSHKKLIDTNDLIINFVNKYSEQNNLELINLNLLDKIFNCNYWFICNKTDKLFFFNSTNNAYNREIINILSELNYYIFTEIKTGNVITFEKLIINNNKSSRDIRYERLSLIKSIYLTSSDIVQTSSNIDMIPATSIRNYMLNDPLIDYLKEYNINSLSDIPSKKRQKIDKNTDNDLFSNHIMKSGIEFEDELIKLIMKNHPVIKVANFTESRQVQKFNETISLMKKGIPIIYQGVLHNNENNTFGLPDLIIRSDYINKLMNYEVISQEEEKFPAPLLGTNFHYKVIDIKHSTITLRSDGIHILNSDNSPAYKGQLYIYTAALNKVQGIKINKAFIWGKKYSYESCNVKYNIINFLNKLAIINYDTIDFEYIEQTNKAINWIKTLREEGSTWSLLPIPCRNELFPNMKNDKDGNLHQIKSNLSESINEITQIWNCGFKKRQIAHSKKIYSWKNHKFNSKLLKMNNGKIGPTIDKILNINRQNRDLIRPKKINYDRSSWAYENHDTVEFYLDFETFNSNLDSIIKNGVIIDECGQYIFMIGIGYIKNKQWIFKSFIMENKTLESEKIMFDQYMEYINQVLQTENKKLCKMYHWSFAEVGSYQSFKIRHSDLKINDLHISFYDLNKVFINEPITIKGALNYSLKTVAKALNKHKLIKSTWDTTSACSSGLNAMILANKLYESSTNVINDPIMKEIIYYNEIDCKVLWEIHELMRTK